MTTVATASAANPSDLLLIWQDGVTKNIAVSDLLAQIQPLIRTERVATFDADGRVLAEDVVSALQVPAFDNSSMDGYAVRGDEMAEGVSLSVIGESAAGRAYEGAVGPGQAVRIFTGAPMPEDRVVYGEIITNDAKDGRRFVARNRGTKWVSAPNQTDQLEAFDLVADAAERTPVTDPMTLDIADGLLDLLGGHDANVWDLALAFAERLGHPHVARTSDHYGDESVAGTLVEQVAAVAAPLYIAEAAPLRSRGAMVSTYQLAITVGILGSVRGHRIIETVILLPPARQAIAIHILGDLITSFGTMIFAPFSERRNTTCVTEASGLSPSRKPPSVVSFSVSGAASTR